MTDPQEGSQPTSRLRRRGLAVAALIVLVLAIGACGGDDDDAPADDSEDAPSGQDAATLLGPEDAATGDPVKLGLVSDGATQAFDNTDELRAGQATVDYLNAHKKGVAGHPIELVTCETGGDPSGASDCANQMVEEGVAAVALSQSAVAEAMWEPLHEAGVTTFYFQNNSEDMLADTESSFVIVNPLSTLMGVPVAVAEDEGADTVAFVTIDVPAALTLFESGAVDGIFENAGLEYDLVRVPPGTADMTTQMQEVASSGAGAVNVIGNDAFCIAAFQGLDAVGYDGAITSISQCITDATREALPDGLEGIQISATQAVGASDDPAYQLYEAVMATYGEDVEDVDNALAMGGYTVTAALAAALNGADGDITAETAPGIIQAMEESDYPGADGLTFQCGGSASPDEPAVCMNGSLRATLDADGNPATYEPVDPDVLEGS
jgi:branched-chain amino acid transport system substrate-binding protein